MERVYHFVSRPVEVEHRHPYLVFDHQDRLHFHLTVFAKEVSAQLSKGTARTYLYAILPWFTFLDTDLWQQRTNHSWGAPPLEIQQAVDNYLVQYLHCKVRQHHQGFQLVCITQGTQSTVSVFLSGLKLFYRVMRQCGYYSYANPLVDPVSAFFRKMEGEESGNDNLNEYPRMPEISGVTPPQRKARLSDSYFKLEGEAWIPQIVDDPTLPAQILAGGRKIHWKLREECVTRVLFESGGRISEVVGLTLGDWMTRGMLQEASTFSKGSHGVRVKFLRFSNDTAKLLRRYFDDERREHDTDNHTLAEYVQLVKLHQLDANTIPLFLSIQRTQLSDKTFRENFWNPACKAAKIDVDIHQARHWYVTMVVRQIYETAQTEGEVKRRLRELIEYIKWKHGWQTMEAYEHYFDATRHGEIQDVLYQRLEQNLQHDLTERKSAQISHQQVALGAFSEQIAHLTLTDPDFDFLRSIGGGHNGNE